MKVVIDIPDEDYNVILENANFYIEKHWGLPTLWSGIVNGTPLPKGHGRLIDADAYIDRQEDCGWLDIIPISEFNRITPTIIDADKLHPDCMTRDGKLAISQSQLANAPTISPYKALHDELNKGEEE